MAHRAEAPEARRLVGLGRLELPTSRLSSARSNQLSYKPVTLKAHERPDRRTARAGFPAKRRQHDRDQPHWPACSSAKKEKRRRRNPANGTHPDLAIVMAPECF